MSEMSKSEMKRIEMQKAKTPREIAKAISDHMYYPEDLTADIHDLAKAFIEFASRAERMNAEIHRLRGRLSHYEAVGIWNDDKGTE